MSVPPPYQHPAAPRALPPLTDLPDPRRLPREGSHLVLPLEILAESTGELRGRLLRRLWAPALVLLGLWYLLLILYVTGASPTFWFLSLLVAIGEPSYLRSTVASLGFTPGGLGRAFLLLPAAATLLSLLPALYAPTLIARMNPRRFLTEQAFQREVSTRVTALLMLVPVLVVLALPLTLLTGLSQPWSGLVAGAMSCWFLGIGALPLAWLLVRRLLPAGRLLGTRDVAALTATAAIDRDLDRRAAALAMLRAQDRRHLPPNLGSAALRGAATPRGAATALGHIARAGLTWSLPAVVVIGWVVLGIADMVVVFTGFSSTELTSRDSSLRGEQLLVALPVLVLVMVGIAFSPALAVMLSASQREQVRDLRTREDWAHRARVNPWEVRVVQLTGTFTGLWVVVGTVLTLIGIELLGVGTTACSTLLMLWGVALMTLQGLAASSAMRRGLRDVLYGPAGDYMRRETPYALVAPEYGTRTEHAQDPAVRAAMRARMQADGGDGALEIFDLGAAGERLWVDGSEPGATDTAVREADLARGALPDFGGEGSAFTGGGRAPAQLDADWHGIPDSVDTTPDQRR